MPEVMYGKLGNDAGVILHPAAIQELIAGEGGSWTFATARVAAARLSRRHGKPVIMHRRKLAQFRGHAGGERYQDRVVVLDLDAELRVCKVCGSYYTEFENSPLLPLCVDCDIDAARANMGF